jgi:GAF domain-containing protein
MNQRVIQNDKLPLGQATTRRLVIIISLIGFIATTVLTVTAVLDQNTTEIIINGSTAILLAISLVTAWSGRIGFGRAALPLSALISISYLAAVGNGINDPGILAFAIVIAIAALLLGGRGLIIYGLLSVVAIFGIIATGSFGIFQHSPVNVSDIIGVLMALIVSTIILYLNARQLEQSVNEARRSERAQIAVNQELLETKNSLEKQAQELAQANELNTYRIEQLRLVADVANTAASIQELERLLETISELISQRFDVYHTGIFLLDDNHEYANLRAANSAGGQRMLARGHRLQVGAQGIVGSVTATGNPRIALDVGKDPVYFNNPDLPDTHSEIALPLKIAGETIGALDLQSIKSAAFSKEDIEVLTILTNQLAIAIQNARSFEAANRAIQDAESAYQQLTGETWNRFSQGQSVLGYHFDGIEAKAITKRANKGSETAVQIPVKLRGQEIGKLKLNTPKSDRVWSQDEVAIVQAAAERAALALENARLLENAQRRATREQIIGEISTTVSSSTDMEEILRSAVQELGRKMGGAEVVLELGADLEIKEKAQ